MMKNSHLHKILFLALLAIVPTMGWAQTFRHYQGVTNQKGDYEVIDAGRECLRQKTHECQYTIPVGEQAGATVNLVLPFSDFNAGGSDLEPQGYFRWYNYDTDNKSDNLSATNKATKLVEMRDGNGVSKGLVAYKLDAYPTSKNVGVVYTRPSGDWKGETIACDVSKYVDCLENNNFQHEPTLSIRYIFHLVPAKKMADDMLDAILKGEESKANDLTYEDNKEISVGLKDGNASFNLRLNTTNVSDYYFHPMSGIPIHHVFYDSESHKIKKDYFDTSKLMQANMVMWRVYTEDKTKCFTFWKQGRFLTLSLNGLNGASGWYDLNNNRLSTNPTFTYGSRIYVVAYVYNTGSPNVACPVANFTVTFYNYYPMTKAELQQHSYNTRLISYLDDHYKKVATISFDNDNEEQTTSAPTSADDNMSRLPSKWSKRSYGFVFRDLISKATGQGAAANRYRSPIHGEYGLYKSANLNRISGNNQNQYHWWNGNLLYDRTHEITNGSEYGYFLYVDAADESRQIAEADFKANLCAGSQVFFSSAIADMTTYGAAERPQLMFKLYGVHYDESTNNETDRKLLYSFSTGDFKNNCNGDYHQNLAKWYQGYGKIVLQKESGVNNYENFKIVVDNLCKSTSGADYAFDDLRIYTQAAKVNVIQSSPICPGVDTEKDSIAPSTVQLKLRSLQETMAALADHVDGKKLYYRFVDAEGNPVKTVNYGTKDAPNYQWGSTTIYNKVDEKRQIDGAAMYEKIDDEWYVVLANRYFNLESNKYYYLSLAFDDETISDKSKLDWGKPSNVCSLYSESFKMVQQQVAVTNSNGNIATSITIPCDDNATPQYDIKAQLQTVDQSNGGSINLNGVLFDWYIDDAKQPTVSNSAEFKNVKLSVGDHTIRVMPVDKDKQSTIEQGGVSYKICLDEMSFKLRVVKDGPRLDLGASNVTYPANYTRTVRLGLPQVKLLAQQAAKGKGGFLHIPVSGKNFVATNSTKLDFVEEAGKNDNAKSTDVMYLSGTNDPAYKDRLSENLKLGTLEKSYIEKATNYLGMKFMPQDAQSAKTSDEVQLHEGYWYEGILIYREDGTKGTTVLCAGESYVRFEVVPEYVTWNPTANNKMSAAWNNDQNWIRSTAKELYKTEGYTDYDERQNSYVPMKFTKVTIPNLSGLYFPDLGYMAYQSGTGIATKLGNAKGDAVTSNIQYAMMAKWDAKDETGYGLNADGDLDCEPWYGNTCDQIYFKPGGELLDQCYLKYNKAWVEKEMKPNTWYALTSPLQDVYAGDMFVPKASGRQETEAFQPITFSDAANNRVTSPVYQRSWDDQNATEVKLSELGNQSSHAAYDYSGTDISFDQQALTAVSANWSHVYNKVDKLYSPMEGFAIKMGDSYTTSASAPDVLMRLPKADKSYTYYNKDQEGSSLTATLDRTDAYRLVVNEDQQENALGKMSLPLVQLSDGNAYYLVGNPYMATLSMYKFIKANPAVSPTFYVYENGALKPYDKMDMSTTTYDSQNDVTIAPMQAFFVRLADGQSADQINFTSAMTVDREVRGGVKTQASDDTTQQLSLQASCQGYSSEARVVVNAEASDDYDASEDAQLLYDSNLKNVPTLYSVAGNEAVAVNTVSGIHWIPIGVVYEQQSDMQVDGTASMAANGLVALAAKGVDELNAPLYLYDAATKQYQEVKEGESLSLVANDHGRYFLTQTRGTTGISDIEADDEAIKIYSPAAGMVVVSSPSSILNKVEVYTVDGKLVTSRLVHDGQNSVTIQSLPSALYIVKATTNGSKHTLTRKLSIQ